MPVLAAALVVLLAGGVAAESPTAAPAPSAAKLKTSASPKPVDGFVLDVPPVLRKNTPSTEEATLDDDDTPAPTPVQKTVPRPQLRRAQAVSRSAVLEDAAAVEPEIAEVDASEEDVLDDGDASEDGDGEVDDEPAEAAAAETVTATEAAAAATVEPPTMSAPTQGRSGRAKLWSQVFTVALILLARLGLGLIKAMHARHGDAAFAFLDGPKAFIVSVTAPLQRYWAPIAELARGPNAAPVVLSLLILGTKLLKRMDPELYDADYAAKAAAAAEAEGAAAEQVEEEKDGDDDDEPEVVELDDEEDEDA